MNDGLPEAYRETRFVVPDPPSPMPKAFGIVTAFNPMDDVLSAEDNRTADEALESLLRTEGHPFFRAIGGSPDMSHSEPGWAIVTGSESIMAIARRFDQRAYWWIEGDELHLVASDGSVFERLGSFADRILSGRGKNTDWPQDNVG